jgi:hypothetical protein
MCFYAWDNSICRCQNRGIIAKQRGIVNLFSLGTFYTISLSKDNEAASEEATRRIVHTLRKPTTLPTKLAKESEMVLAIP